MVDALDSGSFNLEGEYRQFGGSLPNRRSQLGYSQLNQITNQEKAGLLGHPFLVSKNFGNQNSNSSIFRKPIFNGTTVAVMHSSSTPMKARIIDVVICTASPRKAALM